MKIALFILIAILICSATIISIFDYCASAYEIAYISVTKKELAITVYGFLCLSVAINIALLSKR